MLAKLNFEDLNLTSQDDDILDEDDGLAGTKILISDPTHPLLCHTPHHLGHIQENLEDELVQEALRKGLDLRQYSREIESELRKVELRSVEDCIHYHYEGGRERCLRYNIISLLNYWVFDH